MVAEQELFDWLEKARSLDLRSVEYLVPDLFPLMEGSFPVLPSSNLGRTCVSICSMSSREKSSRGSSFGCTACHLDEVEVKDLSFYVGARRPSRPRSNVMNQQSTFERHYDREMALTVNLEFLHMEGTDYLMLQYHVTRQPEHHNPHATIQFHIL